MTITYGTPALILIGSIAALVIVVTAVLVISDIRANRKDRAKRDREAK